MKFVSFKIAAYPVSSGSALLIVAMDANGELWWLDTYEKLPGPRWHPMPGHPRKRKRLRRRGP